MSRFSIAGLALGLAAMWALQGCGSGSTTVTTTKMEAGSTTVAAETTTTAAKKTTAGPTTTSTTTKHLYPGGLMECFDVSTYHKTFYPPDDGPTQYMGQCKPSESPGAFYTNPGDKDGKSDKSWACFTATTPSKDQWTNEFAKAQGWGGACLFADYNITKKPSEIEDCLKISDAHPAQCSPGPDSYWGACYSESLQKWKCIQKDSDEIGGDVKGDCKSQVIQDDSEHFYSGVCRFPPETQETYKCDTVPTYSAASAGTCAGGPAGKTNNDFLAACFSLTKDTTWSCMDKSAAATVGLCDWMPAPGNTAEKPVYYAKGKCVFKGSEEYDDAKSYPSGVALVI